MKTGRVMSVTGRVDAEALGVVLPHEHLLIDLRNQFTPFADPKQDQRSREHVAPQYRDLLLCNPYALQDNLLLDDVALTAQELRLFAKCGGRTVVDCTSVGIGRDARRLRDLSEAAGLTVVAGCGYYTADTHTQATLNASEEALADAMLRDLLEGIDGTDIRAGVIGELGTSRTLQPSEGRVLDAAARVFRQHPVGVSVHAYPWEGCGVEAAMRLIRQGVDPARIVVCHVDVQPDLAQIRELLHLGVFLEFDNFGKEFRLADTATGFAGGAFITDAQRIELVCDLVEQGHARQLLLSNDVCLKCLLCNYGGSGYGHVSRNILPALLEQGIPSATITLLIEENPRRWLSGVS